MSAKRVYDEQYEFFRKAVLKRDGKKCQYPGCNCNRRLQVHHIQKWATAPYLRYSVPNGITLCIKHHKQIKDKEQLFAAIFMEIVVKNTKIEAAKPKKRKYKKRNV